ncbi:MAG TPA: hypothetical protein VLM37_00810, partial [Fibrobacteraceae bacterium]|nr:hypothetical protein [Fibrobacteraceae bacterium]
LNDNEIDVDKVRQPAKRLVIYESDTYGCFSDTDSVQLHELVSFDNLPYIVEEEYLRKVHVDVITRLPALLTDGTGYYDANGDGIMDSVVFHFASSISAADVAMMNFTIPWYSYRNLSIQLQPDPADLIIDPNDSTYVSWVVKSTVQLKTGLTSLPAGLSDAELYVEYPVFDSYFVEHRTFAIQDKMAPVITSANLTYSEEGDTLHLTFSEKVDYANITRSDIFQYSHGGDTLVLRPLNLIWADDGLSVDAVVWHAASDPVIPGDYVLERGGLTEGTMVVDLLGNSPLRDTKGTLVEGGLNQLVQMTNMGTLDPSKMDSLSKLGAISVQWLESDTRTSDLREAGKVGQLIELGQRFLPQLVEQSGVDADSIDPSDITIAISTYYFDNAGQYVTDTVMLVPCTHQAFGGNCLTTDKKLFIDWNFKDSRGRFVGTGAYVANYSLFVRYESVTIKEDETQTVGVRRTK